MRRRIDRRVDAGEDGNYFVSMSDLMTGVVFIFVILLCAFALRYQQAHRKIETANAAANKANAVTAAALISAEAAATAKKDADAARNVAERLVAGAQREARDAKSRQGELLKRGEQADALTNLLRQRDKALRSMLQDLHGRLSAQGVRVEIDAANGVLRLPDSLLFESGSDLIKVEGVDALRLLSRELAPVLRAAGSRDSHFSLEAVFIEGHTDNVKIRNGRFSDNWDLSAARAIGTYRTLVKESPELESFLNPAGSRLLGVSGYGENRPVAENTDNEGRAKNRRIDLRFLIAYPSEVELRKLEEMFPSFPQNRTQENPGVPINPWVRL